MEFKTLWDIVKVIIKRAPRLRAQVLSSTVCGVALALHASINNFQGGYVKLAGRELKKEYRVDRL
jgi:hypothetical protein